MLTRIAARSARTRGTAHHWPRGGVGNGMTHEQAHAAMRAFLHAMGWDASDFTIQVEPAPALSRLMGVQDRLVTVACRSSGQQRSYTAGPFSSWLAELLQDVEQGGFGLPRRPM